MRIRRKIKRATRQYIIVAFICIFVIGGAAIITSILLTNQIKDEYEHLLAEAKLEKERNTRNVYLAAADIKTGDFISKENVERKTVYASQPEITYITSEDLGKVAMVDIPAGTHIQNSMLTGNTISSELRELQYDVININSNIIANDTVDVRIFYPNGENYIILSKKLLKGYSPETVTCFFWLNEEELLRMSAAIVDAGLYPGSRLYVSKYIEPQIQEASEVNYIPSLSILSLIESDPNIVTRCSQDLSREVRKALENRLAESMTSDIKEVDWDVNPNTNIARSKETKTVNDENFSLNEKVKIETEKNGNQENDFMLYSEESEAKKREMEYGE